MKKIMMLVRSLFVEMQYPLLQNLNKNIRENLHMKSKMN